MGPRYRTYLGIDKENILQFISRSTTARARLYISDYYLGTRLLNGEDSREYDDTPCKL
jgi:hypothetical protein